MLRIVAGEFRGRRLHTLAGSATRPTQDRIKESLFSILGPIDGTVVFDLFAGSGSLGLEALSRGAKQVVFVEQSRPACAVITQNIATLKAENRCQLICQDVAKAPLGMADLIFADPPYTLPSIDTLLPTIVDHLNPGGVLVLEMAAERAILPPPLVETLDHRVYGVTQLLLWRKP